MSATIAANETPAAGPSGPMTGAQRFAAALAHKEPDRVPIHDSPWAATIDRWRREGLSDHSALVAGDLSLSDRAARPERAGRRGSCAP